jgi:hypothetical protein
VNLLLGVWAFALLAAMITATIVAYLLPPEDLERDDRRR